MSKGIKVHVSGDAVKVPGGNITSFYKAWREARREKQPVFITNGDQSFAFDEISIRYVEEY